MVRETAYAKINLSLDVIGRLPNGYHEVRMVMQTVDIRDELTFERTGEPGGITLELAEGAAVPGGAISEGGQGGSLSLGPDNLICRAAEALRERCGIAEGVRITLDKHIPIAAGMAGGSADAAATMRGMNRLFGCSLTEGELCELGARLGADIPFCICGGTMLAEGIGERLTRLPDAPELVLAIAKPSIPVSTPSVYRRLDEIAGWRDARAEGRSAEPGGALKKEESTPLVHPDVDAMTAAIRSSDPGAVAAHLGNILEAATIPACPAVVDIQDRFRALGARGVLMSGSGPTVFAVFDTPETAATAIRSIRAAGLATERESFVTRPIRPGNGMNYVRC